MRNGISRDYTDVSAIVIGRVVFISDLEKEGSTLDRTIVRCLKHPRRSALCLLANNLFLYGTASGNEAFTAFRLIMSFVFFLLFFMESKFPFATFIFTFSIFKILPFFILEILLQFLIFNYYFTAEDCFVLIFKYFSILADHCSPLSSSVYSNFDLNGT